MYGSIGRAKRFAPSDTRSGATRLIACLDFRARLEAEKNPEPLFDRALWGTKAHLDALFGAKATVATEQKHFVFRSKQTNCWLASRARH